MRLPVLAALLTVLGPPARAEEAREVDLALVLAVDISLSMTAEEQHVQREGYVAAFRSNEVRGAVRQGLIGRIAVTYVEWAGATSQFVVVPWTVIGSPEEADRFAERLARMPPRRSTWTSIAGALDFSVDLLRSSGFEATRRVIDVSGDGPNNQGRPVTQARDEAVAAGVVVNGLPLMIRAPTGPYDIPDLDLYYRDCVIGGPGAFMVLVRDPEQFAQAIRTKIVREVAAGPTPPARIVPVLGDDGARGYDQARCAATGRRGWYGLDP